MDIIPAKLNPYRLARQFRKMSGCISLSTMERLNSLCLQESDSIVRVDLQFGYNDNICFIDGKFATDLRLLCQRCMQMMEIALSMGFVLSPDDSSIGQTKYEQVVLDSNNINIHMMIEDEILLNLPYFPSHSSNDCCQMN